MNPAVAEIALRVFAAALIAIALAAAVWCGASHAEYTICRDSVLAKVDRDFAVDSNSLERLETAISSRAERGTLGNWFTVLMREECALEPISHRRSAEHRLLWSLFLRIESSRSVARLFLAAIPASGSAIETLPLGAGNRRDLTKMSDEGLACLADRTLHVRSPHRCKGST